MPQPYSMRRLLWSSDGQGVFNNGAALTAPQQNASGNSGLIDVQGLSELFLEVLLASFTGGTTPSFQPEWDALDDLLPNPNVIPLWKPTAATAATKWLTVAGAGMGTAPTVTGFTVITLPISFGASGRFAWTIAGAPTAVSWSAYLYGK